MSSRACCSALRTSALTFASGFRSLMAALSFCPPVTLDLSSENERPRFCEACSVAAHSAVLLKPLHASCVDMPAGTIAARRVFCAAEMLDCAVEGSVCACGLDGSLCRVIADGSSVEGTVEGCDSG